MAIWLLFLANSVLSKLPDPDLGVYYKAETVDAFLTEIKAQNSSVVTLTETGDFKYIILNTKAYPNNTLPTTVFVGSMHGGFPFTTYSVLYYLDKLVNGYNKDTKEGRDIKYIVDTTQFIFIPIANYLAYSETERLYNSSKSFTAIYTGLEGTDWNCTENEFAGINPDYNFPIGFVKGDNKCSDSGYTGDSSLTSEITKFLNKITTDFSPNVIFSFQQESKSGHIVYSNNSKFSYN